MAMDVYTLTEVGSDELHRNPLIQDSLSSGDLSDVVFKSRALRPALRGPFPRVEVQNVGKFQNFMSPVASWEEVSVSFWMNVPEGAKSYGTVFSYSTRSNAKALGFWNAAAGWPVLGQRQPSFTGNGFADGRWHHVCMSWSAAERSFVTYVDGRNIVTKAGGKSLGKPMDASGTLVLGQRYPHHRPRRPLHPRGRGRMRHEQQPLAALVEPEHAQPDARLNRHAPARAGGVCCHGCK